MGNNAKKIAGIAGSTIMLVGMGAGAALAAEADAPQTPVQPAAADASIADTASNVSVNQVRGTFAFSQGTASSNEAIARAMGTPRYLCGATAVAVAEADEASSLDWTVSIGGEVENEFTATMEELAEGGRMQVTMGCNCAGNPADGQASVDANVTGATLRSIIDTASPVSSANTVVFASADGYEVALPLSYVQQRYALLVFDVNGAPLCDTVGGSNQLWLSSTAANYFARNIVSITFETRQTPPPAPGTAAAGDMYDNLPNVAISSSAADA